MEETEEARKLFSALGGRFLIGAIVIYALQFAVKALLSYFTPAIADNSSVLLALGGLTTDFIGLPLIVLLMSRIPTEIIERRKMKPGHFVLAAMMCYAVGIVSNVVGNIVTIIISLFKGSMVQNEILNMTDGSNMLIAFVYMVICAPIMEEIVFRKVIVDRAVRYGQGVAVVVSGLMFGLFHGNLNQFVYAFTLGVFFAFLYVKTGNLKITIGIHMIFNFIGSIVLLWVMRQLNLPEYLRLLTEGSVEEIRAYFMESIMAWMLCITLEGIIFCVVIAGVVLLIVALAKRKFTFAPGIMTIPRGKRFRTVILNAGMVCYCLFWIAVILWQLFL